MDNLWEYLLDLVINVVSAINPKQLSVGAKVIYVAVIVSLVGALTWFALR